MEMLHLCAGGMCFSLIRGRYPRLDDKRSGSNTFASVIDDSSLTHQYSLPSHVSGRKKTKMSIGFSSRAILFSSMKCLVVLALVLVSANIALSERSSNVYVRLLLALAPACVPDSSISASVMADGWRGPSGHWESAHGQAGSQPPRGDESHCLETQIDNACFPFCCARDARGRQRGVPA